MAQKWELPRVWVEKFQEMHNELVNHIVDLRDQFVVQSEEWQESEEGDAVTAWLEELDEITDTMDRLMDTPEDV